MSPTLPSNDYQHFDNVELVTFTPTVGSSVSSVAALRLPLSERDSRTYGDMMALHADDMAFHLFVATLAGAVPDVGDVLTDAASDDWEILCVSSMTFGTRYKTICRKV